MTIQQISQRLLTYMGIILYITAPIPLAAQQKDSTGLPIVSRYVSMYDAVAIALQYNPIITAKKASLDVAKTRVEIAKTIKKPQVSATTYANAGDMQNVFPSTPDVEPRNFNITSDNSQLHQNIMLMYPLYTGGKHDGQIRNTQETMKASSYDLFKAELDVALAVKLSHCKILLTRLKTEVYKKRLAESLERVRIAQEFFDSGRIAKYDLLRNQTELADAQQELNNAQKDTEIALIELKSAMGISQLSQIALTDDFPIRPVLPDLETMQTLMLKNGAEAPLAKARVLAANENIKVAKSAYKPQVYATLMADINVSKGSNEKGYLIGIAASIPIFDAGQRDASVKEAVAIAQETQAYERDVINAIVKSVAIAYAEFNTAKKNQALAQAAITQAEEDYRVIKLRYEAGKTTNAEVLDAFATITKAELNKAEAIYEQNIAYDMLTWATGEK